MGAGGGGIAPVKELSVAAAADECGAAPALIDAVGSRTWSELAEASRLEAETPRRVEGTLDLGGGATALVVRVEAGAPAVALILGSLEAGVPLALVPPTWSEAQLAAVLGQGLAPQSVRLADLAGSWSPEAIAALVATSGTTGGPRFACLSRRAIQAAAVAGAERVGWSSEGRWWAALAPSTVGGLSIVTRALVARGAVALGRAERFEPEGFVAALADAEATHTSLVPTMLARLVRHGRRPPGSLRAVLVGGAAAGPELLQAAWDLGWPALPSWGATETAAQAATLPLSWWQDPASAPVPLAQAGCGPPLPGVRIVVDDPDPDGVGVLEVQGPTLFSGYFGQTLGLRSWQSGDLARVDEVGNLHVIGRRDGVLITGGRKIHPEQIEVAIAGYEGVEAACVLGLPDPEWGQRLVALIETADPSSVDLDALRTWLGSRLERWQVPRELRLVPALPRLSGGKIDRRRLAAELG
jgi:O-succinylbenzoic acid--CoA ligase